MAATSKNAAAPDAPTGSSPLASDGNPIRLVGWFTTIVGFLRSMSPSSAATYDSGWVDVTYASGFKEMFAKLQVRRIGYQVIVRGDVTHTSGQLPSAETVIGTVPAGFRPPRSGSDSRSPVSVYGSITVVAWVDVSGGLTVYAPTGPQWTALSALSGYTVD